MIVRKNGQARRRPAFTLAEMVAVVAIIVVLAGISVPVYLNVVDGQKRAAAQAQCKQLAHSVEMYKNDQVNNPSGALPTSWDDIINDPSLKMNAEALRDPWGGQYQLVIPSQHGSSTGYDVVCTCGGGDPVGSW